MKTYRREEHEKAYWEAKKAYLEMHSLVLEAKSCYEHAKHAGTLQEWLVDDGGFNAVQREWDGAHHRFRRAVVTHLQFIDATRRL